MVFKLQRLLFFLLIINCLSVSAKSVITGDKLLFEVKKSITNIHTLELVKRLANEPNLLLLDVRLPDEIDQEGGSIKAHQNINIPRGWVEFRVGDFVADKSRAIVVYCGTNMRSPLVTKTLLNMGYKNVQNYADGVVGWRQHKLPQRLTDADRESFLFKKPIKVANGIYSAIGETGPSTKQNSGHNNNLSFIIGSKSVMVMNAGGSYLLAESLHTEIKKITNKPVKYVVLENAQGHSFLGSSYWRNQGASIIAHKDAAAEINHHKENIVTKAYQSLGDKMFKTKAILPDKVFDKKLELNLGDKIVEVLYLGPAHGPGDIVVWSPKDKLVITGDVAFNQRMLPVFASTKTGIWLNTWKKLVALQATVVIPGHGDPTNMAVVTKYTKDYLAYMRNSIESILDKDGDLNDAYMIDQSAYSHLDTYEMLSKRNAAMIFAEMEFE